MVSLGTQPANRKSGFGHSSPTGARAQDLSRQPARPDLWGARVSNDPGLPDLSLEARQAIEPGESIKIVGERLGLHLEFHAGDQWIITLHMRAIAIEPSSTGVPC